MNARVKLTSLVDAITLDAAELPAGALTYGDLRELRDEIERLERREDMLQCLESAGVDNWQGYDEARQMHRDDERWRE